MPRRWVSCTWGARPRGRHGAEVAVGLPVGRAVCPGCDYAKVGWVADGSRAQTRRVQEWTADGGLTCSPLLL
eukprot:2512427-Pyramimonas_sp.AAC.1